MGVYYARSIRPDELMHFGVIGMKWGVRRYQNYDGSYTRKGMEHYRESEKRYKEAKKNYRKVANEYNTTTHKNQDDRVQDFEKVRQAKIEKKEARKQLNRDYNQLENDYHADKGKELYKSGRTITGNRASISKAAAITAGTLYLANYLDKAGKTEYAKGALAVGTSVLGATIVSSIVAQNQNRDLRAYYTHSRPKRK